MNAKMKRVTLAVVIAAILAGAAGVAHRDHELAAEPVRVGTEPVAMTVLSNVSVPVRLDSNALTEMANELVPLSFDIPDQTVFHDSSWTKNPLNGNRITLWSVTVKGYGKVTRTSPISVVADKDGLIVSTTVHASFTAHKGGVRETAKADARVSAKIVLDVNDNWEPIVRVTPTYSWINRPVARLFNLFNLSLGTVAEKGLNEQIGKLQAQLPSLIAQKLPLKEMMASAWNGAHSTARVSTDPETWVSFDPVSVHLSAPTAEGSDLLINIGLAANVALSTEEPKKLVAEPLPLLMKTPPVASGFNIGLPISARYDALEKNLMSNLKNEVFKVPTPAGESEVEIHDVKVYSQGQRLVVGAKVNVDLPDRWLDTKGWVYLLAEPSFDGTNKVLRLKIVSFARSVDNALVRVATAAFASKIESEIRERANIDLSAPLDQAIAKANVALGEGLRDKLRAEAGETRGPLGSVVARTDVAATLDGLTSASFVLGKDQLTVIPVVTGTLSVKLQPVIKSADIKVAAK